MNPDHITHDVFIARTKDTGERPTRQEAEAFAKLVSKNCRANGAFSLPLARLGLNAIVPLVKLIKLLVPTSINLRGNSYYLLPTFL